MKKVKICYKVLTVFMGELRPKPHLSIIRDKRDLTSLM